MDGLRANLRIERVVWAYLILIVCAQDAALFVLGLGCEESLLFVSVPQLRFSFVSRLTSVASPILFPFCWRNLFVVVTTRPRGTWLVRWWERCLSADCNISFFTWKEYTPKWPKNGGNARALNWKYVFKLEFEYVFKLEFECEARQSAEGWPSLAQCLLKIN